MANIGWETFKDQEWRQKHFPANRIAFYAEENVSRYNAAAKDGTSMNAYIDGEITIEELCSQVARHNFLRNVGVSKEAMVFELNFLGYIDRSEYEEKMTLLRQGQLTGLTACPHKERKKDGTD